MSDTDTKTPLRIARENKGYSREKVVRRLDPPVSTKTLERMERGDAPLRGWRLEQLAAIYGVPVEELKNQAA